jgi:hypothetical protein
MTRSAPAVARPGRCTATNCSKSECPLNHRRSEIAPGVLHSLAARLLGVRWFVRAPIWLFRARLGFLAGSRLIMLEHIGRTSGQRRYVVLEVVDHPSPGE